MYVAFGDSWPYGAHCGSCTPFPELYADALEAAAGAEVDFRNRTTNGGTSLDLLTSIREDNGVREDVAMADVIVISTGANDLEPAMGAWHRDECGGVDGLDCFRSVAADWKSNFDAMLSEITTLRDHAPTAVRILTNSNEFLSDRGLIASFGKEFAVTGGAAITALHHDALCAAAQAHAAVCVDLRPVLNGADFAIPADVNTQESMTEVARALIDSGLAELD